MTRLLPAAALCAALLAPSPALAFCGTFVGQAGAGVYNNLSQVVIARRGEHTALTLAFDYEGDVSSFALVIPVPQVLTADDVSTVELATVKHVDQYSGPRLVSYSCSDFLEYGGMAASGCGCVAYDDAVLEAAGPGEATTVEVEESFVTGQYQIVVLSAEESGDLFEWLNANGYAVPEGGEALLGEYIEAGSYFLAAKVTLDALASGSHLLTPLQLRYDSEVFGLPVRIGTLSAQGDQDLLIYALSSSEDGRVGISNYPEAHLGSDCMWKAATGEKFGQFYSDEVDAATAPVDGKAPWITEYAWDSQGCDPCSSDPLGADDLEALGWTGDPYATFVTRLHMRYSAEEVPQDLDLYFTGQRENSQIKYVTYKHELEATFEVCGLGWATDPGTCDDVDAASVAPVGQPPTPGAALSLALLLGFTFLLRRELER